MVSEPAATFTRGDGFRHEALLYAGERQFLAGTLPFIHDAVAASEPILVGVEQAKENLLRQRLGDDADAVLFVDMAEVGRNPARIIPAWRELVSKHGGTGGPLRGIGEPIWPARSGAELAECQRHEALLNVAFADELPWWLLCPYDVAALGPMVIDEALRTHPFIAYDGVHSDSAHYRAVSGAADVLGGVLPEPARPPRELAFGPGSLHRIRTFVSRHAGGAGLAADQADDLVLAVNELVTNTMRHGGGHGRLRAWQEGNAFICEVRDHGYIDQPLIGREQPSVDAYGGRGFWMVNQLCDLVQLRSSAAGTVVRVHMRRV